MELIKGNRFVDNHGIIRFSNEFDMTTIKRMYLIETTPNLTRLCKAIELK